MGNSLLPECPYIGSLNALPREVGSFPAQAPIDGVFENDKGSTKRREGRRCGRTRC